MKIPNLVRRNQDRYAGESPNSFLVPNANHCDTTSACRQLWMRWFLLTNTTVDWNTIHEQIVLRPVEVFPGLVGLSNPVFRGFQTSQYICKKNQIFQKIIFEFTYHIFFYVTLRKQFPY